MISRKIDLSNWRPPSPDRELMVPVEGGRIYVRVNGDIAGSRPPLLMVHGGPGGNHAVFLPALELAEDRAVILYDQLDSGRSDHPGNPDYWTVSRFAAEIDPIRHALGLERLHLLGHSWGGTVALEYAARQPAGLSSLILQGPLVSTRAWLDDARRLVASLPADVRSTLELCEGDDPPPRDACDAATAAFYDRFWRLRPPPAFAGAYESALGLRFNRHLYETMWGPTEFSATGTLRGYDGVALLARLTAPLLLLIGASDEVLEDTARGFAELASTGEAAVVEDAAHHIQTDNPRDWLRALRLWLERKDRS